MCSLIVHLNFPSNSVIEKNNALSSSLAKTLSTCKSFLFQEPGIAGENTGQNLDAKRGNELDCC